MKHSSEQVKEIMLNLYLQLGGHKFVVMTGSKFVGYSEDEHGNLQQLIKLSRNATTANRLYITYNEGLDLYTMRFTNLSVNRKDFSCKEKEIYSNEDVYFDDLQRVFTEVTGLYTRL